MVHTDGPTKNVRRWSSEDGQRSCLTTMVPSSNTTHRFPNRRRLQEGATLRDEARASCRASRCAATHAISPRFRPCGIGPVSYTHLRAHETRHDLVCRLLLEKKKKK